MAEQVFKSPGFYEKEIDLTVRVSQPSGVPAGVIGTSLKGPAFVPVTVGSFPDFVTKFGDLDPKNAAPYALNEFLKNRTAATFIRVLGAGANSTTTDVETTRLQGLVKNAGFKISGTIAASGIDNRSVGFIQMLVAKHAVSTNEAFGMPMFSDNNSYTLASNYVYLTRAVIFTANDTRIMVLNGTGETWSQDKDDIATVDDTATNPTVGKFKLVISSSAGSSFAITDGNAGLKILTASLNPSSTDYVGKILNTDPERFNTEKHLLYLDYALDDEVANVLSGTSAANSSSVAIVSGSDNTSSTSGNTGLIFKEAFGRFDTRFSTPISPTIISQPFGTTEYELFSFEAVDDGAYANTKVKVSIVNIQKSSDPRNKYGTFSVLVRAFDDTDLNQEVLEQYSNVSLDPDATNYVGAAIGDRKVRFAFDIVQDDDRRLVVSGKYPNRSNFIRVVMNESVETKNVPAECLPFGFKGIEVLKTNDSLNDSTGATVRLACSGTAVDPRLLAAIVPPLPFRFKVTRGPVTASAGLAGRPGPTEVVDSRLYWGIKFERNSNVLNPNVSNELNTLVSSLTKLQGVSKLDTVVTGSGMDTLNNNKFSLAKVALGNTALTQVTASAETHMKEAAYIRNGSPDPTDYLINDGVASRITFASLLMRSTSSFDFNKFSNYANFTTVVKGGFDGVNILDKNASRLNDKGTSTETNGGANGSYVPTGLTTNPAGVGNDNNGVFSYKTAINIITDEMVSNVNLVVVPGIRDPFVTDYAAQKSKDFNLAMYLMDIPYYDSNGLRIFDTDTGRYVDVGKTADLFDSRALDNNASAAYFPNVIINDIANNRRVMVPASVAALAAISFNDKIAYPWFAPAGFNRASLDFISLTQTRINQPERDRLYYTRINPIVKFPGQGYVLFSQKTLQQAKTSLDSINVKRMILEVKRLSREVGIKFIFEQATPQLRERLVNSLTPLLANVQIKQGIERFKVVCDDTNNTVLDLENNRINCRVEVKPTIAAEYISIDFVIVPSGFSFS